MRTTDVLSTAAAAERLGIDRSTLTRWVAAGRLTPVVRGEGRNGVMFFAAADVDDLDARIKAAAS